MKRFALKPALLALLALVLIVTPVLAYAYSAPYVITETGSTSRAMLATTVDANNQWMADNGFMETDALDTRIETLGGSEKPHMVASDRTLAATVVSVNSQTNLLFTTGNTDLTSLAIITGNDGFLTISDAAALEPTNNFEFEWENAYIDISQATNPALMVKAQAFGTAISQTNTLFSWIWAANNIANQAAGGNNSSVWGDTWLGQTFTTGAVVAVVRVSITLAAGVGAPTGDFVVSVRSTAAGLPTGVDLASITVDASTLGVGANVLDLEIAYPLAAATMYAIVVKHPTGNGANFWNWTYSNVNPYAGGTYISSLDGGATWATIPAFDLTFQTLGTSWVVESAVIAAGEHTVIAKADPGAVTFGITVDVATVTIPLAGATVPGNGNNWILNLNNATPYMEYYKHTVGGVLIAWYQPINIVNNTGEAGTADGGSTTTLDDAILTQANDYWNGARLVIVTTTDSLAPEGESAVVTDFVAANDRLVFDALTVTVDAGDTYTVDFGTIIDRQGGDENARATWGVNPTGVEVSLGSMVSSSQPLFGGEEAEPVTDVLPEAGTTDWFVEPAVGGTLLTNPLRPFVTLMSDSTTITELQAWRILGLAIVLMVTTMAAVAVKSHLLLAGIVAGAAVGGMVALTIFPLWALVFTVGAIAGGLVAERSPSL